MMQVLSVMVLVSGADDVAQRLEQHDIIVEREAVAGSSAPKVTVRTLIEAAPDKVWPFIDHCGEWEKTLPRIVASKELKREGDQVTCRVTAQMPFPLSDLVSETLATHEAQPGVRYSRTWKMVAGDFVTNQGSWVLTPYKGDPKRTLVVYQIHADPKVALPQAIINAAQSKSLPALMERLRELSSRKE